MEIIELNERVEHLEADLAFANSRLSAAEAELKSLRDGMKFLIERVAAAFVTAEAALEIVSREKSRIIVGNSGMN